MYHMRNGLTTSTGTHIVIEHSPALPNVLSEGIAVATGTETKIALKIHGVGRLKSPYGSKCENKITNPEVKSMYPPSFEYSAKNCNSFCYVVNSKNYCNCYEPSGVGGVLLSHYNDLSKQLTRCNKKQKACLERMEKDYKTCNCHPACHDITYQVIALAQLFNNSWYFLIHLIIDNNCALIISI